MLFFIMKGISPLSLSHVMGRLSQSLVYGKNNKKSTSGSRFLYIASSKVLVIMCLLHPNVRPLLFAENILSIVSFFVKIKDKVWEILQWRTVWKDKSKKARIL